MNKKSNFFKLSKLSQSLNQSLSGPVFENAENSFTAIDKKEDSSLPAFDTGDFDGPNMLESSDSNYENLNFNNHLEFYNFLKNIYEKNNKDSASAFDEAWNLILAPFLGDSSGASQVEDGLKRFFSSDLENEDAADLVNDIFSIYSSSIGPEIEPIMTQKQSNEIINDMIKRSRESLSVISDYICNNLVDSVENNSNFSMKKEAQHKGMENIYYFGPDSVSVSPFTNDIQSGLHRVEQNKGFGLVLDDIKDLDYEAIWRQNIMDKYTQPYRDENGNYVGGYLNKRFEINRNIDPINNMQLPPGVRNRPYVPELGSTEARMEVARGNKDKLSDPFTFSNVDLNLKKKR
jgi:hypothetical protein